MKKLFCLLLVFVFAVSTSFAEEFGSLFGNLESIFSSDDDSNTYAPGETAVLDDYDIKLTNVMKSKGGSENKPKDGNVFLILEFDITNKTAEQVAISSILCFSASVDGKTCQISVEADTVALLSGKYQFDQTIDPGKTQSGIVGYEVPENWSEFKITVKPDVYGSNKATFLIG